MAALLGPCLKFVVYWGWRESRIDGAGAACLVRHAFTLVEGCQMTKRKDNAPKSENPAATGFYAKQNANAATVPPAQKTGNPDKRLATLIAQFARAAHQVIVTDRDDYMVTRWGLVRYCCDREALEAFARQVGVRS